MFLCLFYQGVDPNLLSARSWIPLANSLKQHGCTLIEVDENLIDIVWVNQPEAPTSKVISLDFKYCGKTINQKVQEVREKMYQNGDSVIVVSALDEVAWLFNLRYVFACYFDKV